MKRSLLLLFSVLLLTCAGHAAGQVKTGLDVLAAEGFQRLQGKRVGLVINHTAVDRQGRSILTLLAACPQVRVTALFTPEHGLSGGHEAGEHLSSGIDSLTRAPIYSLYGDRLKPTRDMLRDVDVLIFDMQDVGARFYTYISTLFLTMEAAAEAQVAYLVLDRPNPIGGVIVEGPVLKREFISHVGIQPIALRHGMTIGELALLFNAEHWLDAGVQVNLQVVKMHNWRRKMLFDQTGLSWIKPSPNISTPQTALLYPGMCLLEATNLSEGRGTALPFENIGAPWLDAKQLVHRLQAEPMVRVRPLEFTPANLAGVATNPKYLGRRCHGVAIKVLQPDKFNSVMFGLQLLRAVHQLHPDSLQYRDSSMNRLTGDDAVLAGLRAGRSSREILRLGDQELSKFKRLRKKYLLY
jgi:uncharacterized protein YbbC (DUF1343 family)